MYATQDTIRQVGMPDIQIRDPLRQVPTQHTLQKGRHCAAQRQTACHSPSAFSLGRRVNVRHRTGQRRAKGCHCRFIQQYIAQTGSDQTKDRYGVVQECAQIGQFDTVHTRQHLARPTHQAGQIKQPGRWWIMRRNVQFGATSRRRQSSFQAWSGLASIPIPLPPGSNPIRASCNPLGGDHHRRKAQPGWSQRGNGRSPRARKSLTRCPG
mmetsp:Transcript_17998/g.27419  ORF Transcript_17998/g.27419 Transcript_17998/m.27419 type:complete len:210 (+) Transcript_17998:10825-11454(+)